MSVLQVQAPGLQTTVQDLGRAGFGPAGVSPSGAADAISLRLGNRLVGNAESAAGLEMLLFGGTFIFPEGAIVALTGSDFGASVDGNVRLEAGTTAEVRPGQTVRMGPTTSGARCYLCVRGGIAVTPFLGSAATHILSGLGGFEGRALRKGDLVRIGSPASEGKAGRKSVKFRERRIAPRVTEDFLHRSVLRVTAGPQADWFSEAAPRAFCAETYRVGEQSNRMGLRLEGASGVGGSVALTELGEPEMITEGVSLGAIQVPGGGAPIILFVEQQTTGGYPKIANVIAADMHRVGQLRPRDEVRFELVSFETARSLLLEQEKLLASQEWILE